MTHIKEIKVNYDYLTELVEKLINEVQQNQTQAAEQTKQEIDQFANGLEDYSACFIN